MWKIIHCKNIGSYQIMRLIKKPNKNMKWIEGLLVSYCHTILFKKKNKVILFFVFLKNYSKTTLF